MHLRDRSFGWITCLREMASRKEEKERRRQERVAQERELAEQERRRRLYAIVTGGALAVAAVAAIVVVIVASGGDGSSEGSSVEGITPPPQRVDNLAEAARAADCRLSNPPIEGREHVPETPKYKTNPATSGNHNPVPADDGAYDKATNITNLLHSLEHGRVVYQYDPSIPSRRIKQLKGLFDQDPYHTIFTPNGTKMPYQVAATAWGHLAGCKRVSDESFDVLRAFRDRYLDKGPEFVP
jgi:hypothetical protein